MLEAHRSIEEHANYYAEMIAANRSSELIQYPANGGFTVEEASAMEALELTEQARQAIRKLLASSAASVIFDLFNIIDGTTDPQYAAEEWSGVILSDSYAEKPEDGKPSQDFLHDAFLETYWQWRDIRPTDQPRPGNP